MKKAAEIRPRPHTTNAHWREPDLALLKELIAAEAFLPPDAPRALLSVRLSTLTTETTSPVRQELDLRRLARERGYRVVGVASDLNVSAVRVPPWRRKELGHWLNDRVPEFDVLLFWKLDRLVRRLTDLSTMIEWCLRHRKNLVSKHDAIDLSSPAGQVMAELIGGIAEIEAAAISTRVTSLWDYARSQSDWLVGKPPYGYAIDDRGRLVIDPQKQRVLRWCLGAALRGVSARRMTTVLIRAQVPTGGGGQWSAGTLLRRLRNPALMGFRVSESKNGGTRRSETVLGADGNPIRVADPIVTEAEWLSLQAALGERAKSQPARRKGGATAFLGVLVCADCGTHMTAHRSRGKVRTYEYLRCRRCPSGGLGAPDPESVYGRLTDEVMSALGAEPVRVREYAPGTDGRDRQKGVEDAIAHYMTGLEPGGRYTRASFTRQHAEQTLEKLITELEELDSRTARDRWLQTSSGGTFRERWDQEDRETMADDLRRAGITCSVGRRKVLGVRAPEVGLKLIIPSDARERLVIKRDAFTVESS
ncbi:MULTISPECIES: recombinase family protein [Streptomyces]|uniref:recombinase family protein n=1 Tax=Streptomyces TaxID=1883 RepID=UPI00207AA85C|nr:recombinase family protein [Streptomyces spororaveus]MCM9079521.1 recombinase family protein [Streptomyces spororaveus]